MLYRRMFINIWTITNNYFLTVTVFIHMVIIIIILLAGIAFLKLHVNYLPITFKSNREDYLYDCVSFCVRKCYQKESLGITTTLSFILFWKYSPLLFLCLLAPLQVCLRRSVKPGASSPPAASAQRHSASPASVWLEPQHMLARSLRRYSRNFFEDFGGLKCSCVDARVPVTWAGNQLYPESNGLNWLLLKDNRFFQDIWPETNRFIYIYIYI